jgi:hypothetical protein
MTKLLKEEEGKLKKKVPKIGVQKHERQKAKKRNIKKKNTKLSNK